MADSLDQLYDTIVRSYALQDELIDIDLNATASDSGAEIDSEKQQALERERETAATLRPGFRGGIARALRQQDGSEIALSDQDPVENLQADALIRYLVSFNLASSRSESPAPGQYVYLISVEWDKLRAVAESAGLDFDQAMSDAG